MPNVLILKELIKPGLLLHNVIKRFRENNILCMWVPAIKFQMDSGTLSPIANIYGLTSVYIEETQIMDDLGFSESFVEPDYPSKEWTRSLARPSY